MVVATHIDEPLNLDDDTNLILLSDINNATCAYVFHLLIAIDYIQLYWGQNHTIAISNTIHIQTISKF